MEPPARTTFLASPDDDHALEESNNDFWDALIAHIRSDGFPHVPQVALDVGSHRGGLLERLARLWRISTLIGIEPVAPLRKRAELRLRGQASRVSMLSPAEWSAVPVRSVDLLLAFESLQFIGALEEFVNNMDRVLSNDGRAYVVLGCHAENPVWPRWKADLEALGHQVYTHEPLKLMSLAAERGLLPSVRPLRNEGWITHDPRSSEFGFPSAEAMLNHHFRHKLLFRFRRRQR